MPDPPPPPVIPPKIRPRIAKRIHEFASSWCDPHRTEGQDPLIQVQRELQARRVERFAHRLETHTEDLEREGLAEIVVLVRCCLGLQDDAFSAEMLAYARDVHYVEQKHLTDRGLFDLFR